MNLLLWITTLLIVQQSPASQAPPRTVTPQSYPREMVITGQGRFADECALCHGRDAAGSDTGPDLTRSILVAQDLKGDKIGPLVRTGRVDKGMPSFDLSDGDLNAIVAFGTRDKGLPLLQRLLYPQGTRPAPAPAKVTVTPASGDVVTGTLASRDEFNLSIKDASGATRSWPVNEVKFTVNDPVSAHFDQLGKYSDEDMHNVYAYLQTLR